MKADKIKVYDSSCILMLELHEDHNAEYYEDEEKYLIIYVVGGVRYQCTIDKEHVGMFIVGEVL